MSIMNFSTAIFLVNDQVQAVRVSYNPDDRNSAGEVKQYTFKTFDRTLKKDDVVVVPTGTRHGFTCVKVEEVDVHIPLGDGIDYKWIVAKVDIPSYEALLEKEKGLVDKIRTNQIKKERKRLADDLLGDEISELQKLEIVSIEDKTAK